MQIRVNEKRGLAKAATHTVGDFELSIGMLNVTEAREAYVKLQPFLRGFLMAEHMEGAGTPVGGLLMAGLVSALTDESLKFLTDAFAKKTSYVKIEHTTEGREHETRVVLSERGQMDVVFGGEFDAQMEWLEVCIYLNFGRQIEKLFGALQGAETKAGTSDNESAPKAPPKQLL